jgi:hypothetical protein
MTSAISTFQSLIQEALASPADNTTTTATATAIARRASTPTSTDELDEINAIFADIQSLADGSAPLPPLVPASSEPESESGSGSGSGTGILARRSVVTDTVQALVDCLGRLISGAERRRRRRGKRATDDDDDDLAAALATIHGWADGTIPLPNEGAGAGGGGGGVFTADDGLEFATLLKDVIVAWRAQFEAASLPPAGGALAGRSPQGQSFGLDNHFVDIALDKRGNLGLKVALKLLAAAIDAYADTL